MDNKLIAECTVGELRDLLREWMSVTTLEPTPNVAYLIQRLNSLFAEVCANNETCDALRREVTANAQAIEKLNARLNAAAAVVSACPEIAAQLQKGKDNARET